MSKKQLTKLQKFWKTIVNGFRLIFVCFIAYIAYMICWLMYFPSSPNMSEIEDMSGIKFPHSAKLMESRMNSRYTEELFVKMDMDPSAVVPFVKSLPMPSFRIKNGLIE